MAKGLVVSVLGPVNEEQIRPEYAAMDIDVWLNLQHVSINGRDYTNNDVLRAVADTTGSHYDASIEPLVEALIPAAEIIDLYAPTLSYRWT